MMPTKRIEYLDALRGFTMFLVVYTHVVNFSFHLGDVVSFNNILRNFFLSLFFFVSGFFALKVENEQKWRDTFIYLKNKAVQLLIPTLVFGFLFCYNRYSLHEALGPAKGGYWFTFQLFLFILFYVLTLKCFNLKIHSKRFDIIIIITSFIIYCISFSHVTIEKTQIGTDLFHYLGMKNWRYYAFFAYGVLVKKYFQEFKGLTNSNWMAFIIIAFFAIILFGDKITWSFWKPINMLLYGGLSIIVIFTFFEKYETSFISNTYMGYCMQYIGRRTLDIYMIHYFLLPRKLHIVGEFFTENINPLIEFFTTTAVAILVMACCIVIGNIIRLSPQLAHYLLGAKIKK